MCQVLISFFWQDSSKGGNAQGETHTEAKQPQSRQHLVKHLGLPVQVWTQTFGFNYPVQAWPPLFGIFTPARPTAISHTFEMSPWNAGGWAGLESTPAVTAAQASIPCVGGGWMLPEISLSSTQFCCQGAWSRAPHHLIIRPSTSHH